MKPNQALVLILLASLTGCSTSITPPATTTTPVTIYLVDYGRHSSIVVPDDASTGFVEYTYGDWAWFATGDTRFFTGVAGLFVPTRGALGRRPIDGADLTDAFPGAGVEPLTVDDADVATLRTHLDTEHAKNADTAFQPPGKDVVFVHHDAPYTLFHNCNHVTIQWLEMLGCDVSGFPIVADFAIDR